MNVIINKVHRKIESHKRYLLVYKSRLQNPGSKSRNSTTFELTRTELRNSLHKDQSLNFGQKLQILKSYDKLSKREKQSKLSKVPKIPKILNLSSYPSGSKITTKSHLKVKFLENLLFRLYTSRSEIQPESQCLVQFCPDSSPNKILRKIL